MTRQLSVLAALAAIFVFTAALRPAAAHASLVCSAINDADGLAGKACQLLGSTKKLASAGKKLVSGHVGSAVKSLTSGGGAASSASTALGLAAIVTWVVTGAKYALSETVRLLGETTTPQLRTSWFSGTYWRIAGIAAVLTLPFLFAAATQALLRSDLALLARAALGYLPLAMLAVGIAAPLTMLLLAATDQLCAAVSAAGGGGVQPDLSRLFAGAILAKAPFLVFLVGALTTAAAVVLWLELAIREAAVYVIVLMLPLAFAALVWPSRRVWAVRAIELLVALILAKFAIVAVLVLGGSALDRLGHFGLSNLMAALGGTVLVLLAVFSPWAVVRLLPMSELAGATVGSLRGGLREELRSSMQTQAAGREKIAELAETITSHMRRQADDAELAGDRNADERNGDGRAAREPSTAEGLGGAASPDAEQRLGTIVAGAEGGQAGDPTAAQSNGSTEAKTGATGPVAGAGSASAADGPSGDAEQRAERAPGLGPMFQAEDLSWRPLKLGLDGDWVTPLWSPESEMDGAQGDQHEQASRPTGEDHDPLPPRQEPEGGSL